MLHISSIPLTDAYVARHGDTVEAFTSVHPWEVKKMSVTEAGRLQEWKNTEFLRELRKTGFCEFKVTVRRAVHLRECALGELPLTVIISNNNDFLAVLLELKKRYTAQAIISITQENVITREFPISWNWCYIYWFPRGGRGGYCPILAIYREYFMESAGVRYLRTSC